MKKSTRKIHLTKKEYKTLIDFYKLYEQLYDKDIVEDEAEIFELSEGLAQDSKEQKGKITYYDKFLDRLYVVDD